MTYSERDLEDEARRNLRECRQRWPLASITMESCRIDVIARKLIEALARIDALEARLAKLEAP